MARSAASVADWRSEHPVQLEKLTGLRADIAKLADHVAAGALQGERPWDRLMSWSETALGVEAQELVASLILEPYGDLVDDLTPGLADTDPDAFRNDGAMPVAEVRALIEANFGWALRLDWTAPQNCARAWYVSQQKLEPRVGERFEKDIAPYEQPLAPARDAAAAHAVLSEWDGDKPVAEFFLRHAEHRPTMRRAQISQGAPNGEIQDNTISADMFPVDLLRVKRAFFGATHFDPRSDRWLRICMFADAPYPEELTHENTDLWAYPEAVS